MSLSLMQAPNPRPHRLAIWRFWRYRGELNVMNAAAWIDNQLYSAYDLLGCSKEYRNILYWGR